MAEVSPQRGRGRVRFDVASSDQTGSPTASLNLSNQDAGSLGMKAGPSSSAKTQLGRSPLRTVPFRPSPAVYVAPAASPLSEPREQDTPVPSNLGTPDVKQRATAQPQSHTDQRSHSQARQAPQGEFIGGNLSVAGPQNLTPADVQAGLDAAEQLAWGGRAVCGEGRARQEIFLRQATLAREMARLGLSPLEDWRHQGG